MTILSISGTPCTGKSSAAALVGKMLGWEVLDLNKLAEKKGLYSGFDKERNTKIVDVEKVESEVVKLAKSNLILESHYAHDLPNDFTIILRCNPGELRKRMKKRGWPSKKIEENVQAEIMEICLSEALEHGREVLEIDTTGLDTGEVARKVVEAMLERGLVPSLSD